MPENHDEATAFGIALALVMIIASLGLYAGLIITPHLGSAEATVNAPDTPTPTTTDEPYTPDCPAQENATAGRCVDADGDGEPDYRCVDNVDCGDDEALTRTPEP